MKSVRSECGNNFFLYVSVWEYLLLCCGENIPVCLLPELCDKNWYVLISHILRLNFILTLFGGNIKLESIVNFRADAMIIFNAGIWNIVVKYQLQRQKCNQQSDRHQTEDLTNFLLFCSAFHFYILDRERYSLLV